MLHPLAELVFATVALGAVTLVAAMLAQSWPRIAAALAMMTPTIGETPQARRTPRRLPRPQAARPLRLAHRPRPHLVA